MIYPADFSLFWEAYPRKRDKRKALAAWQSVADDLPPPPDLIERLFELCLSPEWVADGGKWIPYPATWLRAHGWHDEPSIRVLGQTVEYRDLHAQFRALREQARKLEKPDLRIAGE